jgi:hypothetical protein
MIMTEASCWRYTHLESAGGPAARTQDYCSKLSAFDYKLILKIAFINMSATTTSQTELSKMQTIAGRALEND